MPVVTTSSEGMVNLGLIDEHLHKIYVDLEQNGKRQANASYRAALQVLDDSKPADRREIILRYGRALWFADKAIKMAGRGIRWGW